MSPPLRLAGRDKRAHGPADREVSRPAARDRRHTRGVARRGVDATPPRSARVGAARRRGLREVRGREPDRQLQGPGHDRRHLEGARGGRPHGDLRVDGEHRSLGGGLRGARRARRRRPPARGRRRELQDRSGTRSRRTGAGDTRKLRRGARRGARARRARDTRARQLGQPVPGRGPEDRGVRDRRGAWRPTGRSRAAVRRRRKHVRLRARLRRGRRRHAENRGRRGGAARDDACVRDPDHATRPCGGGDRGRSRHRAAPW